MTSFDRRGGVEEASRGGPGTAFWPFLAAAVAGIEPVTRVGIRIEPLAGALVAAFAT